MMSWQGIQGHDPVVEKFRLAVERNRLASTFLFVGPGGVGKRTFALKLAAALLCERNPETAFDPCGVCPACQQVAGNSHPDLELVTKPKNRNFIPVETFIGDREHRMREGLCHNIGLKPFRGGRKVAIIDDADFLNQEGANCLLKTLEEPPSRSVLILICTSEQKQLPTIRSRCQIIRFQPLSDEVLAELILSQQLAESPQEAANLAHLSHGSLDKAVQLVDDELRQFRPTLFEHLALIDVSQEGFPKQLTTFVEAAGKETPKRRARLETVVDMAVEFYRDLVRSLAREQPGGDPALARAVQQARAAWTGSIEQAADCLQRCIEAHSQIRGNANLTTLIECWLDDLSQIGLGRPLSTA